MTPAQIEVFFATLKAANPHPQTELEFASVFELLTAVLLSAQATDVGVNKATRRLFNVANTPQKILDLGLDGLEGYFADLEGNSLALRHGADYGRGRLRLAARAPQSRFNPSS